MRTIVLIMLSLVCLAFISQYVMAASNLDVVITYPDGQYEFGSEVEVTVHVFDNGQYSDVQEVDLGVGDRKRPVNMTREGIGLFTCTIVLKEEDLSVFYDVALKTRVKLDDGWVEPRGGTSIHTVYDLAFKPEIVLHDFNDRWLQPGDTVLYDVLITFMGEFVDPDPETLKVDHQPLSWPKSDLERIEIGHYTGSFSVPEGLNESEELWFAVHAEYTWENITYYAYPPVYADVEMLQVWCEKIRADQTGSIIELHVRDMGMEIIEGARVELHASYNTYEGGVSENNYDITNGTTDAQGSVTFSIEYPSIDPERPHVMVAGIVYHDDLQQQFDQLIEIQPNPLQIGGLGRLKVNILNLLPLPLESPVTLEMEVLDGQDLIADTHVGYCVYTLFEVITTGIAKTDRDGLLSVPIVTPGIGSKVGYGTDLIVRLSVDVDGEVNHIYTQFQCWHEMGSFIEWYDGGTTLEVEQASPGGNLSVSLSNPQADGTDEEAFFFWGVGPIDWGMDISFGARDWTRVSSRSMFEGMEVIYGEYSGGNYTADIPIPAFVPNGSELFVVGVIGFHEESGVVWTLDYVGGSKDDAGVDDDDVTPEEPSPDWYPWVVVLSFVIVALVVFLVIGQKKDDRSSPER